nr:O-antigen ligase family protein [Maricaulis parjimensis]
MARLLCAVRAKPPSRQSGDRTGHRLKTLIIPVSTLILCGSDLFLTASRAGISLAMSGVILLLIWDGLAHWRQSGGAAPPSQRNLPWLFPLIACLLGLLFMMSGTLYASRLDLDGLGMGNRAQAFAAYWEALRLRPVFGDGLGSFAYTNDLIATASQAEVRQLQGAAHNVLLQWGLQAGIAGTVAMLIVWSGLWEGIRRGLRMRRRQRTELRAVLVIMLVVAAHGMVDYALEIPAMSGLLALLIGLARAILWRRQGR